MATTDADRPVSAGNIKTLFPENESDVMFYMHGTFPLPVTVCGVGLTISCNGSMVSFVDLTINGTNLKTSNGYVVFTPPSGFQPVDPSASGTSAILLSGASGTMNFAWNGSSFVVTHANPSNRVVSNLIHFNLTYAINPIVPNMTGDEVVTYKMLKQLI